MKRGDLITAAFSGDYGKPRPAVILQADEFKDHPSLTVLPLINEILDLPVLRIHVEPSAQNGLRQKSQLMVDKIVSIPRAKAGCVIGTLDATTLESATRSLAIFLGMGQTKV